jgi:hypothetical protein
MTPEGQARARKEALDVWDDALEALSASVEEYCRLTSELQSCCEVPQWPPLRHSALPSGNDKLATVEDAIAHVDEKLQQLVDLELQVHRKQIFHSHRTFTLMKTNLVARIALQGVRNKSHILVPINRLPPEILSLIFMLGAQDNQLDEDEEADKADEEEDEEEAVVEEDGSIFTFNVTQVCRHWREVALNTGMLWTKIDFAEGPPFDRTRLWLERSKHAALDVYLELGDSDDTSQIDEVKEILHPHVPRCTTLSITVTSDEQMRAVVTQFVEGASEVGPRLNSLTLVDTNGEGLGIGGVLSSLGATGVRALMEMVRPLESLTLDGVHVIWDSVLFTGLKELTLRTVPEENYPPRGKFFKFLRQLPMLESLTLDSLVFKEVEDAEALQLYSMESLHTLDLRDMVIRDILLILAHLQTPALRRFTLFAPDVNPGDADDDEEDFVADEEQLRNLGDALVRYFSPTKTPNLRRLSFEGPGLEWDTVVDILKQVPGLEALRITEMVMDDTLLDALTNALQITDEDGSRYLCPRLTSLSFRNCDELDYAKLLKLIQTRNDSDTTSIRRLSIKYSPPAEDEYKERFETLVETIVWGPFT